MPTFYILQKFATGMHYILLDKKTVLTLTKNKNKRAICNFNNLVEIHCAIVPKKEGGHFVSIGSAIIKKLKIKEGAKVSASFAIDDSEYQFEMPEELKEVLNTDKEAYNIFQALTEGNKRGLIYLVAQVKASDKKIERALKITVQLKKGITSPRIILK